MPSLTNFSEQQIPALLASKTIDASKGVLFGKTGSIKPHTVNRTILIGLGGTGVRTIDYVKGQVTAKMDPTWKDYISFLGIDTDDTEYDNAKFLNPTSEEIIITTSQVGAHGVTPKARSIAQKRLVPDEKLLQGVGGPGAKRTRQIGAFKVHDTLPGVPGVDEMIVSKIQALAAETLLPIPPDSRGAYEVYVIGSVCGGTCSGTFLEMPALIDRALTGKTVHSRAILYLPDTLTGLDPGFASEMYANGYASLKELDYYMGEAMRLGYTDKWGYNNDASPEIELPREGAAEKVFFNLPYLVGSQNPGSREAANIAMETIAEQLVGILGKMSSTNDNIQTIEAHFDNAKLHVAERSFLNPVEKTGEADGENHDRPKHYAAIGFAEASAPEKTVRAYTVSKACTVAGLKPVTTEERANLINHGETLLPFRGEDDLLTAMEGTQRAEDILQPVKNILGVIHSGAFNFAADLDQQEITWRRIHDHAFDGADIERTTSNIVANRTNSTAMEELRRRIRSAFADYRDNVIAYVKEEGPLAFCNLFAGRFIPRDNDNGTGIETMLKNLSSGILPNGRPFAGWMSELDARQRKDEARAKIANTSFTVFNIALRNAQQAQWTQAYERWVKSRIDEKRREFALGSHGAFVSDFLQPAQILNDELRTFGYVLASLSGIYSGFGASMKDYDSFRNASDNLTEVNLAAISSNTYDWIKQKADDIIAVVNGRQFRDNLIEHFFANRADWIDVPQNRVKVNSTTNAVSLVHDDTPVPARVLFDEIAARDLPPMLNVSIKAMFDQENANGRSYEATANAIVSSLKAKSGVQFNGNVTPSYVAAVYPASLLKAGDSGAEIAAAIKEAFEKSFAGMSVQVFSSDDADTIRCYQVAAPFELYHLHDLAGWELEYEAKLRAVQTATNRVSRGVESGLHCMSPSAKGVMGQVYKDVMPWEDYPSVVLYRTDPRIPDATTGIICREGQLRLKLDEVIAEARKLGVLYCEKLDEKRFQIRRVFCDQTIAWDRFDLFGCPTDPKTGMMLLGKDLAETIAAQHDRTLNAITKPVVLAEGGIFAGTAATEEDAWKNAARVLRRHVPMYMEVLKTLEKFRSWSKEILLYNEGLRKRFRPAKMLWMMKALVLRQKEDGTWVYATSSGADKLLANLSKAMFAFLPPKDKRMIDNGLLGYYLFNKLDAALQGDKLDERYEAARKRYEEYMNQGEMESLQKGMELANLVLQERAVLLEKGLAEEETKEVRERFRTAMGQVGLEEEELLKVQQFYYRVSLIDCL